MLNSHPDKLIVNDKSIDIKKSGLSIKIAKGSTYEIISEDP